VLLNLVKLVGLLAYVVRLVARVYNLKHIGAIRVQLADSILWLHKLILFVYHAILGLEALSKYVKELCKCFSELEIENFTLLPLQDWL